MEFNYVTKTAKKQNPVDYKKLSLVLNNLMELYLTVANIPKYASSMTAISTRLQTDLWELYSTAAHTTLMMTLDDDLWIDGRKAWLKLERWGKSKRVSDQNIKSTGFSRVSGSRYRPCFDLRRKVA